MANIVFAPSLRLSAQYSSTARAIAIPSKVEVPRPISSRISSDAADGGQISFADVGTDEIRQMLESADLNTLTPIEAMNLLFELQKKARG